MYKIEISEEELELLRDAVNIAATELMAQADRAAKYRGGDTIDGVRKTLFYRASDLYNLYDRLPIPSGRAKV